MSYLGVRSSAFHRDCATDYFEGDGTEGSNLKADDQSAHADDLSLALHTHLDNRFLPIAQLISQKLKITVAHEFNFWHPLFKFRSLFS